MFPRIPLCRKLNVTNPVLRFYNLNVPCFKVYIILLHPHHAAEIPNPRAHEHRHHQGDLLDAFEVLGREHPSPSPGGAPEIS